MFSTCIQCKAQVEVAAAPQIGTQIRCTHCSRLLEVIWLYPLVLDVAEIEMARREEEIATLAPNPVDP